MDDPSAVKPDDWAEDAPERILDEVSDKHQRMRIVYRLLSVEASVGGIDRAIPEGR